jgi:hypothetical protein
MMTDSIFADDDKLLSAVGTAHVRSLANDRIHYYVRARVAKSQRQSACSILTFAALRAGKHLRRDWAPCIVLLTRFGPRNLDDDNLAAAFKHFRDGVADFLGVDDGDTSRVRFRYAQERGEYGYRIDLYPMSRS